jgi:hypothetical protein
VLHNQQVMLVHVDFMLILKSYVLEIQVHMSECRKSVSICIELYAKLQRELSHCSSIYINYFFFSIVEYYSPIKLTFLTDN